MLFVLTVTDIATNAEFKFNREINARKRKTATYQTYRRKYEQTPKYKAWQRENYRRRRRNKAWVNKFRKQCRDLARKRRQNPLIRAQLNEYVRQRSYRTRLKYRRVLWKLQKGRCPVCKRPLPKGKLTHVDHDHSCQEHATQYPCPKCIRGLTHPRCNTTFVSIVERAPHLQSRYMKHYLSQRPLAKTFE